MALRELLAKFDVRVDGAGALKSVNANMSTAATKAGGLVSSVGALRAAYAGLAAVITGFVGSAIVGFITSATQAVDPIGKLSTAIGASTDSIQAWKIVAEEAGGSLGDVAASFRKLAAVGQDAADGGAEGSKALKELGLNGKDFFKLRLEDQFLEVASALGRIDPPMKRVALAQELLGRGALKLMPGFKGSREEMAAALETAKELSGVFSEDFIRAAEATNDELGRMKNQWAVLKSTIVMAMLPAFRAITEALRAAFNAVTKFVRQTGILDRVWKMGGIAALGVAIRLIASNFRLVWQVASRFLGVILRFARVIAPWLAWALILDDIVVFLQGGDSALGYFLDKLFGAGTAAQVLEFIKAGAARLWEEIQLGIEWLGELWAEFENSGAAEMALRFIADMVWLVIEAVKLLLETIAAVGILVRMTFGKVTRDELDKLQAQFFRVTRGIDRFFDAVFDGIAKGFTSTINFLIGGVEDLINFLAIPMKWLAKMGGFDAPDVEIPKLGGDGAGPALPRGGFGGGNREVHGGDINVEAVFTGPVTKQSAEFTKAELGEMTLDLAAYQNKKLANDLWADE